MEKRKNVNYELVYRKALENYPGSVFIVDKNANVLFLNDYSAQMAGQPKELLYELTTPQMVELGFFDGSAGGDIITKNLRDPVSKFIRGYDGTGLYAIAIPSFDEKGDVEYVYTYTQTESVALKLLSEFQEKRDRIKLAENQKYILHTTAGNEIVANDLKMRELYKEATQIAKTDSEVFIHGESGVGKDIMARYIHENSSRANREFITVNCAAIPEHLAESELFGYEKGSFTGASSSGSMGIFEAADGGTVFLDEIGELSLSLQSKLLRVIENHEIKKIGSNKIKKVNVRLIVATNRDLKEMVKDKLFRADLYYRLNVIPIEIPPLRKRRADIVPFAELFLNMYNEKNNTKKVLAESMHEQLESYDWPGNVRELKNAIERFAFYARTDVIEPEVMDLKRTVFAEDRAEASPAFEDSLQRDIEGLSLKEAMTQYEKRVILAALTENKGNVVETAKKLQIHKSGLYKKIHEYNLDVKDSI